MKIETTRLLITDFTMDMCEAVWRNSLDEDNRRFVPDEVFETLQEAQETVAFLMKASRRAEGPFVYPVVLKRDQSVIGHVQICPMGKGIEVGYHIAADHTGNGYATEAVGAFVPVMLERLAREEIWGVVLQENLASRRVLEKCGFQKVFEGEGDYQGKRRMLLTYRYSSKENASD